MTELNLSERIINQEPERWKGGYPIFHEAILKDDVKEFIRLCEDNSEEINGKSYIQVSKMQKFAGEKLTK